MSPKGCYFWFVLVSSTDEHKVKINAVPPILFLTVVCTEWKESEYIC